MNVHTKSCPISSLDFWIFHSVNVNCWWHQMKIQRMTKVLNSMAIHPFQSGSKWWSDVAKEIQREVVKNNTISIVFFVSFCRVGCQKCIPNCNVAGLNLAAVPFCSLCPRYSFFNFVLSNKIKLQKNPPNLTKNRFSAVLC